jgi:uncharacterized membrane protein
MSSKSRKNSSLTPRLQDIAATHVAASYYGPIPPASEMLKYEEACPGLPSRIMAMAENQSAHRQRMEAIAIKASSRNSTLGVVFAFILSMTTLCIGGLCIFWGKDGLGPSSEASALLPLLGLSFTEHVRTEPRENPSGSNANAGFLTFTVLLANPS